MARSSHWCLLVLGLVAAPARAQQLQAAAHLNDPTGTTQYLSVANKTGLEGFTSYTLEAWVHPSVDSSNPTIIGNDYHTSYWLGLGVSNHVRFYPRGGAGLFFEGTTAIPTNRWSHIAATYDGVAGAAIYVNGVLDATDATFAGPIGTSTGDLRIGADRESTGPNYFWHGALDEIRIWNVARTATEILEHFRVGIGRKSVFLSGTSDHLVALWDMTLPGTSATPDVSGDVDEAANPAAFVGGDDHMLGEPGAPTSDNTAAAFNGTDDHAILPLADGFADGLTIDAWLAPTSFASIGTIVGRDRRTSFWLGVTTSGHVRFHPTGGLSLYFESHRALALNRWAHVAVTYQSGDAIIYLNGEPDVATTAYNDPVGENGLDAWVGADHEPGVAGTPYAFAGYLDNVRISRGVWSVAQIRDRRFRGYELFGQPQMFTDERGTPRETWRVDFGQREDGTYTVQGSAGQLVRSGAPLVAVGMSIGVESLPAIALNVLGGTALGLPDDQAVVSVGSDLPIHSPATIAATKVFVTAPINDLQHVQVRLRSPAGTWVELVSEGAARGMDLHTVFDDASALTLASGFAPYYRSVRPSQPLSAWNSQPAAGSWRLELVGTSMATRVGLWAWGLQFNGAPVGVERTAPPRTIALRNTGGNPVRRSGRLAFTLPRPSDVDLTLFDAQGRVVRSLLAGHREAGSFALDWAADALAPGAYFLRLRVDGRRAASLKVSVVR